MAYVPGIHGHHNYSHCVGCGAYIPYPPHNRQDFRGLGHAIQRQRKKK